MNNKCQELENRLESLVPRRPSPRIERRLFGLQTTESRNFGSDLLNWMAPAVVTFAVLLVSLSGPELSPMASVGNLANPLNSVEACRVYAQTGVVGRLSVRNEIPSITFGSTNLGWINSSVGLFDQ